MIAFIHFIAATTSEAISEIEVGLLALFPVVIALSAMVIKPAASEEVKRMVPLVISLLVAVLYFLVEAFPGWGPDLVVSIGALVALAMKLYEPLSAVSRLLTGRSLNSLSPGGLIG